MTDRNRETNSEEQPLISPRFLVRIALFTVILAAITSAIGLGGHWLGQRMALGGHSDSREIVNVTIGEDILHIPANMIRFENQRHAGPAERLDVYLTWPGMKGYETSVSDSFDDIDRADRLIFLQISQSTMSKDMSGRLDPIYRQLFDGKPRPFDYGLALHVMKPDSGYGQEIMLTATAVDKAPYAVRCLLPTSNDKATSADCQRDIHAGQDLTVLYRFSSTLLKDWDLIDAAVESFVKTHIDNRAGVHNTNDN